MTEGRRARWERRVAGGYVGYIALSAAGLVIGGLILVVSAIA